MKLRFGTFLAPNILSLYQAVAEAVGDRLGIETDLVVETDYENCAADVNDVCFVCSLPYVMFERQGISPAIPVVAPVLSGERYGGTPIYFSDVIVRRDSDIEGFEGLRGRSWAYNEPLSHSGYGVVRHHLVRLGETDGYFSEVVEAGFHETAIELVRTGAVDGAAIDSQVLEVTIQDDPRVGEDLRIVETLGPSTIQPVAISKRLPADLRESITEVILNLHLHRPAEAAMRHARVERFVPVGPSSYDDIRRTVDECEAAGFMELR